jgi:hypothetical protein
MDYYGTLQFKDGQESITIDSYISGTIDVLGVSGKWKLGNIKHRLGSKKSFTTAVELTKEEYNVANELNMFQRKAKTGIMSIRQ